MDSEIEKTLAEIDRGIEASICQVDGLFSDLIFGLKTNAELAENLRKCYQEQLAWLNKVYGWRILQFVQSRDKSYSEDNVNQDIIDIDRSTPGLITIVSSEDGVVNSGILKGIIAEEIRIERRR